VSVAYLDPGDRGADDSGVGKAQDTPTDRLAMPDPRREVARAVHHLIRRGLTAHDAASRIVHVTIEVEAQLHAAGFTDLGWIHDLWIAACVMEAGTKPESGREDDTADEPASAIAAQWAADITDLARSRGIVGHVEG
jgi:hypothetical protein